MPTIRRHGRRVKGSRPYDASGRRRVAEASRARVIDVADASFRRHGYAATTISSIADAAGVSVDMIYKSFGGKPGLIRALRDRALAGVGPIPAETRSDALQASERDPAAIIRGWGEFVVELSPLAAPVLLLVRDAASTDPELRSLRDELDADRLRRMTLNAKRLHAAGHLRRGISVDAAARVLWTYSSAEMYELVVLRGGMPLAEYGSFVADAMIAALL